MRVIGLDLSLTHTGYVIRDNDKYLSGTIKPKSKGIKRLYFHYKEIKKLLQYGRPDFVIIEGYAYSPHQGRSFSIGELGGIIKFMFYCNDISYLVVAPTTLKKFATGKGNAPKSEIAKEVWKRWSKEFKTEHEVDAFVLCKIGESIINKSIKLTNPQKEVVETIRRDKSNQNYIKEE